MAEEGQKYMTTILLSGKGNKNNVTGYNRRARLGRLGNGAKARMGAGHRRPQAVGGHGRGERAEVRHGGDQYRRVQDKDR